MNADDTDQCRALNDPRSSAFIRGQIAFHLRAEATRALLLCAEANRGAICPFS
jgi:hypothetical protein